MTGDVDPSSAPPSSEALVDVQIKRRLRRPPRYRVVLINDDFTPMEFVIKVLVEIFNFDGPAAERLMLTVHTQGRGVCGLYPRDVAETHVARVQTLAKREQHPLRCEMEIVEDEDVGGRR